MANQITHGNVWYVDTAGIITTKPIRIKFIQVIPSAAGGTITLDFWDQVSAISGSEEGVTATISGTNTFTSTGNITAAHFPQYSIVNIIGSNGNVANIGYWSVGTAGNNDRFITIDSKLTNEASIYYHILDYQNYPAFVSLTQATNALDAYYFMGDKGMWLPNLALRLATNAAALIGIAPN